jgi:hypothetical protein
MQQMLSEAAIPASSESPADTLPASLLSSDCLVM